MTNDTFFGHLIAILPDISRGFPRPGILHSRLLAPPTPLPTILVQNSLAFDSYNITSAQYRCSYIDWYVMHVYTPIWTSCASLATSRSLPLPASSPPRPLPRTQFVLYCSDISVAPCITKDRNAEQFVPHLWRWLSNYAPSSIFVRHEYLHYKEQNLRLAKEWVHSTT